MLDSRLHVELLDYPEFIKLCLIAKHNTKAVMCHYQHQEIHIWIIIKLLKMATLVNYLLFINYI